MEEQFFIQTESVELIMNTVKVRIAKLYSLEKPPIPMRKMCTTQVLQ